MSLSCAGQTHRATDVPGHPVIFVLAMRCASSTAVNGPSLTLTRYRDDPQRHTSVQPPPSRAPRALLRHVRPSFPILSLSWRDTQADNSIAATRIVIRVHTLPAKSTAIEGIDHHGVWCLGTVLRWYLQQLCLCHTAGRLVSPATSTALQVGRHIRGHWPRGVLITRHSPPRVS